MTDYNKLVRDRIPEIMNGLGRKFQTRRLEDGEYVTLLQSKLTEETKEYLETTDHEQALIELADILEVIHALAHTHRATYEELEHIRQHKRKERGGFYTRTLLVEVED